MKKEKVFQHWHQMFFLVWCYKRFMSPYFTKLATSCHKPKVSTIKLSPSSWRPWRNKLVYLFIEIFTSQAIFTNRARSLSNGVGCRWVRNALAYSSEVTIRNKKGLNFSIACDLVCNHNFNVKVSIQLGTFNYKMASDIACNHNLTVKLSIQLGTFTHKMAVPVPGISCCVFVTKSLIIYLILT
jgi:hypothetical protein